MTIIPPPEIRNIIDKTAAAVAKNGPAFEVRIRESEKTNSKFSFLNPLDPYRPCKFLLMFNALDYDERVASSGDTPIAQAAPVKQPVHPVESEQPAPPLPPAYNFLPLTSHPPISQADLEILQLTGNLSLFYT